MTLQELALAALRTHPAYGGDWAVLERELLGAAAIVLKIAERAEELAALIRPTQFQDPLRAFAIELRSIVAGPRITDSDQEPPMPGDRDWEDIE